MTTGSRSVLRGVFVSAVGLVAVAAYPSEATAQPDLVVSSVSRPPAALARTDNFAVTEKVKNKARTNARPSEVDFFLSSDRSRSRGDLQLIEWVARTTSRLQGRRSSRRRTTLTVPQSTALTSYYVLVCADGRRKVREKREGNNCRASRRKIAIKRAARPPAGMTSAQLIEAAAARGLISSEQSLEYRTFVAFGDIRLPSRYRGDDDQVFDSPAVAEIGSRFASLSVEAKAVLKPFLLPPGYRGSWTELRGAARTQPTSSGAEAQTCRPGAGYKSIDSTHARVWWDDAQRPGDRATAREVSSAVEESWPKLAALMERTPPSDAGWKLNGCDARFDVYLFSGLFRGLEPGVRAVVAPILLAQDGEITTCNGSTFNGATFGAFDAERTKNLRPIMAHELMHAFQAAYIPCLNLTDLQEATADWAIDFIYPTDNLEQIHAPDFFEEPRQLGTNGYADYVFYFDLARSRSPQLVQKVFAQLPNARTVLQAIDQAIPGGFRSQWPGFVRRVWNRVPADEFTRWDGLSGNPYVNDLSSGSVQSLDFEYREPIALNGAPTRILPVQLIKGALSGQHFRLDFPDPDLRFFAARNLPASDPDASTQALVKADGAWRIEDWSDKLGASFCRDLPAENLEELVLIFAYTTHDDTQPQVYWPSEILASNIGCYRWTGTSTGTVRIASPDGGVDYTQTFSASNLEFERSPFGADQPHRGFDLKAGNLSWSVSGIRDDCSIAGSGTTPLSPATGFAGLTFYWDTRHAVAGGRTNGSYPVTETCGSDPPFASVVRAEPYLGADGTVAPDGQTWSGTWTRTGAISGLTVTSTWTWNFTSDP